MTPFSPLSTTDAPEEQSSYHARPQSRDLKSPNSISTTYIDGSDYQNESSVTETPDLHPILVVLSQKS